MSDLCTLYEKAGQINESETDNDEYEYKGFFIFHFVHLFFNNIYY